MAFRIHQGVAVVSLAGLAVACVGQEIQRRPAQTALTVQEPIANHACLGSSCGTSLLASTWTLGERQAVRDPMHQLAGDECLGSGCGPTTDVTTWTLESPFTGLACLGTVCGVSKLARGRTLDALLFAESQPIFFHRQR